jgi:hypothetical protein
MTRHSCARCGYESTRSHGSWPDRHPFLATISGLFSLTLMAMMFSVYPVAAWTMTVLAAVWFGERAAGREHARRNALAARADYEHAVLMARASAPPVMRFPEQPPAPPRPPGATASRHVMNRWPTTPMPTVPLERSHHR